MSDAYLNKMESNYKRRDGILFRNGTCWISTNKETSWIPMDIHNKVQGWWYNLMF